jgi:hypothetical protein
MIAVPPDSAPPAPDLALLDLAVPDAPASADSAGPAADAAVVPHPAKPSGCAFGGTGGWLPLVLAFLALVRRARR